MDKLRQLLNWEWYGNTNMVRLFLHLLLKANTSDDEWHGIAIARGSLITCTPMLSTETGLTEKQVRLALERLEKGGKVGRKRAGKMTIITVCEFDDYAHFEINPGQKKGRETGDKMAGTKEDKKEFSPAPLSEKKEEKKKILSKDNIKEKREKSFVAPEYEELFSLWLEYKRQRRESYKSEMSLKICYNKLVKLSGNNPDTALAIVEQSIANNWAGLFGLKNNSINFNNGQQQTYINDPVERRKCERARRLQALAARIAASQAEDSRATESPF